MAVMNPRASNPALPDFSKSSRDLEVTAVGLTQNPVPGAEPSSHGPRQMIGALRGGVPFLAIFVMFGFVEPHHGARLAASHAHLVVSEFHGTWGISGNAAESSAQGGVNQANPWGESSCWGWHRV